MSRVCTPLSNKRSEDVFSKNKQHLTNPTMYRRWLSILFSYNKLNESKLLFDISYKMGYLRFKVCDFIIIFYFVKKICFDKRSLYIVENLRVKNYYGLIIIESMDEHRQVGIRSISLELDRQFR